MKLGKPTATPGIYATDDPTKWIVRVRGAKTEKRRTVTGTIKQARIVQADMRATMEDAPAPPPQRLTVGDSAPFWIESLAKTKKQIKPSFFRDRVRIIERFILPYWGAIAVEDTTPKHVQQWKEWLADQRQSAQRNLGQPYRHGTLITAWATLRTLLQWASVEVGMSNPMLGMRFDLQCEKLPPKQVLTREELSRVIPHLDSVSPDMRALIICCFASGGRFAETSCWHWEKVDLDKGTVRIDQSQTENYAGKCKTEATRKVVYLLPEVVEVLRAHRRWQLEVGTHPNAGTRVFPSTNGKYRSPSVLRKPMEAALALAGIDKRITAHCTRKTSNNLVRKVASPETTRAMIGHSTSEMTFVYSHSDAEERLSAARAAFGGALAN